MSEGWTNQSFRYLEKPEPELGDDLTTRWNKWTDWLAWETNARCWSPQRAVRHHTGGWKYVVRKPLKSEGKSMRRLRAE